MENMYMDLYDRVVEALDEYGILYGDVVDNGDGTINIVGVDESEWDDVVMAIEDLLGLEVEVPSEDHEEFDDELVVIGESLEKESCVKYTKPTKEDIDEWDPDFDICCKDVADGLDSGRWHGQTSSERSWGLIVNGGDGSQFSPLFADVVAYEISYPVRDGLFSYDDLDCVPNKSTFSYMSEEDWKDEEKLNTLKNDLISVGCSEEDIEKFFKDEISEIEFFIDYEIDIDDLEEDTNESLKEATVKGEYKGSSLGYSYRRVSEDEKKDLTKLIGKTVLRAMSNNPEGEKGIVTDTKKDIYGDTVVVVDNAFSLYPDEILVIDSEIKEEKLSESKLEKTTFEYTFKATDKKYARYISELEDALGAEELYGGNILEIKNIICHMNYNVYDDGVDAEFEFQFDALVDGDFDETDAKGNWIDKKWIRFKLFNDGPAFNGYYTSYGPEVEPKDEVMMDVSCYKGNQAIIELLQEAGYEPIYNGVGDILIKNIKEQYATTESLKEEKEEKLETFEDKMNFLAKDEQEAIDGYDKIIAMLDSEQDAFVIEQLTKIRIEEEAHKKYLEDVKTNKDLEYTEPLEEPKKEESLKEAKKGFVTFLNLECGVLLAKDHPEFKDYSVSYDHKHGYYDETYLNSLEEDLDLLKESGLKYIKEGVNGTYAILTKVNVQGSMEDNYIQDAIKNIKDGMFIENSVELLDGEQFKASNVIWSAYKDENGEIHENFVDTSVTEGCKKQLKEDINDDVVTKLQSLYDEGDVYFDTANDNGETFLIVDGWEDVHKIQKALRPDFEPKDEYDTSVLDEIFGYQGDGWGFRDSYSKCDSCGNVIQTEPDSYSWTPDFFVDYDKGEIICGDCVRKNPQDYLETLYNNPKKANTILSAQDLINNGFEKIEGDYENGWYDKHDSPEEILDKALEAHPSATFIFNISSQGQFATKFELWGADLDLDEKLIKEGVSLDNPSLKKGITYLNRYPNSFGYICSYLNNKTHQQVLVNKGFKTEKELMKYVKEIEKNKDVVDVSVIRQGEQSKYYKAMKKDNKSLENLDSSNKVNEEYKAEDVFEFEDDVPMTFGKIVDMMFDELKTSALDDEAYTNTLSDEELEKLAIQYAEDYIKDRKGKKVVK